jgi:uncharacterized membrane protein
MFLLLVFLHLAFVFAAVAVSYGPTAMFLLAVRSNRVEAVRSVGLAVAPVTRWIALLFIVGGIFGLAAAFVTGYNLLAPWLVISYVLFVVASLIGALYGGPLFQRVGAAIADIPSGPLPPAAANMVKSPVFLAMQVLDFSVILLLILDMVFKPFS